MKCRLLTFAERDPVLTGNADSEFCSVAIVKSDKGVLQLLTALPVEALCQSLGWTVAGHEGIPSRGAVAVEVDGDAFLELQIEITRQ